MKNKLGKVTFGLLCSFLVLYALYNFFALLSLAKMVGDWKFLIEFFNRSDFILIVRGLGNLIIGPMILWTVGLIYTIIIGQSKKVNRLAYMITALAVLTELFFSFLNMDFTYGFTYVILTIFFDLLSIAYFTSFVLLFVDDKKQKMKKAICILFISTYVCTVIYIAVGFIQSIVRALTNFAGIDIGSVCSILLGYGVNFILLIIGGLVLGYILFPEKYLKTEE